MNFTKTNTPSNNTACVILCLGKRYKKLGQVAYNSFVSFHEKEVDTYLITDENLKNFKSNSFASSYSVGILKYIVALEVMTTKKYKKVIVLGSDTITCARLDEFLDNDKEDILATLDYPYQLRTPRAISPDSETHINADVVCFNNPKAIEDIISVSPFHTEYFEQGGLNEIAWMTNKYSTKIVDYPYSTSNVVYNVRCKGNIIARTGEKPWAPYAQRYSVKDNKIYSFDGKQLKVFHYCEGLGGLPDHKFYEIINWWIFECFNEDTKLFFKHICNSKDFFEKRYEEE